ncbi:unnamed protein product [Somion occarium]|uniref:Uncharacterized protein n=1 Tax=Somion occarium TaxID=3059160 RepID=A0ABP1E8D7_9APHY
MVELGDGSARANLAVCAVQEEPVSNLCPGGSICHPRRVDIHVYLHEIFYSLDFDSRRLFSCLYFPEARPGSGSIHQGPVLLGFYVNKHPSLHRSYAVCEHDVVT